MEEARHVQPALAAQRRQAKNYLPRLVLIAQLLLLTFLLGGPTLPATAQTAPGVATVDKLLAQARALTDANKARYQILKGQFDQSDCSNYTQITETLSLVCAALSGEIDGLRDDQEQLQAFVQGLTDLRVELTSGGSTPTPLPLTIEQAGQKIGDAIRAAVTKTPYWGETTHHVDDPNTLNPFNYTWDSGDFNVVGLLPDLPKKTGDTGQLNTFSDRWSVTMASAYRTPDQVLAAFASGSSNCVQADATHVVLPISFGATSCGGAWAVGGRPIIGSSQIWIATRCADIYVYTSAGLYWPQPSGDANSQNSIPTVRDAAKSAALDLAKTLYGIVTQTCGS